MDSLKWITLGLCIFLVTADNHDPSTEPEDPMYYGTSFDINELAHDVRGKLHIIDERHILLTEFHYDGQGPDAFFYVSTTPGSMPSGNGIKIPDENGSMEILGAYADAKLLLTLPDNIMMKDLVWFSVWCGVANADFGNVMFGDLTDKVPKPMVIGQFTTGSHDVRSGDVKVLNHKQIMIMDFYYDGQGPDAFFYVGDTATVTGGNTKIPNEEGMIAVLGEYTGQTFTLTLPAGITVHNIKWLSVWCDQVGVDFGHIMIPENLLVPVYLASLMDHHDEMYYGTSFTINELVHDVRGMLHIVDDKHILLTNFFYDGQGPDAFFYISTTPGSMPSGNGIKLADENGSMNILGQYVDATILLTIPDNIMMKDLVWFSVWCGVANADFGNVMFGDLTDKVPKPMVIGQFITSSHDVRSGDVKVLNHKQIMIIDFYYDGQGPDAYFYIGMSEMPMGGNTIVPDENGSMMKLGEYTGETITLTLPEGFTVHNIKWLSVWCEQVGVNFGHVMIPDNLLVPVYLMNLNDDTYYGHYVDDFTMLNHDVTGKVFIVDMYRIRLVDFNYDGQGPDAFFYVGFDASQPRPDESGTIIPNEMGKIEVLLSYDDADIVLTLPEGKTVHDILWISVWCRDFGVDFGHVIFPDDLGTIPAAVDAGTFTERAHDVRSGTVTFLDERRVEIQDFHYDGQGPDAFFWVGTGSVVDTAGMPIMDEFGSSSVLNSYNGETIIITLPEQYTWNDFDYLSVWCRQFSSNFGEIWIPSNMYLPPYVEQEMVLTNCLPLHEYFQVFWEIVDEYIYFDFIGALEEDGYMSFGRSGSDSRSSMIGADVLVAYMKNGRPMVDDYFLTQYAQCNIADGNGACPDMFSNGATNVDMISGRTDDGITRIRFRRMLSTGDAADLDFMENMYVVWGMGILGQDNRVTKHNLRLVGDKRMMAGDMCRGAPVSPRMTDEVEGWDKSSIWGVNMFQVDIGPAGGAQGYAAITGRQSWGIAYYINDMLIPEIHMYRGETYRFVINGGNNVDNQAEYHPFYLTEDADGGYLQKSQADKDRENVIAGIDSNGDPTAEGTLCEYRITTARDQADASETFEEYFETLERRCREPKMNGELVFTPDEDTPDLIYYQCYTHRFLGWKIHVWDEGMGPNGSEHALPAFTTLLISAILSMFLGKLLA